MTDEQEHPIVETVINEIDDTEQKEAEDDNEADSIQKPAKKKGRPPLTDKQKEALAKGREKSRRNQIKRMAKEKLDKIEKIEKEESNVEIKDEEPKKKVQPKINKKKPKKQIIIESDSDSSDEQIVYVSKKKKKKPKRKVIIESSSEDDDSDEDYPPQQPVHNIPQRRLIFK